MIKKTLFNSDFFVWTIFAAVSPGIIAFSMYTYVQKKLLFYLKIFYTLFKCKLIINLMMKSGKTDLI